MPELPTFVSFKMKNPLHSRLARSVFVASFAIAEIALAQTPPAVSQPASQPATATAVAPATAPAAITGSAERGKSKIAACIGCHGIPGYKADFPQVYSVPMIGGQNAKYIESALKAYQKGERKFPTMIATARALSDQDIADIAAYYAQQR